MTVYRARRLPVHRGVAAWRAILPPPPAFPALEGERTADVVVIGAGFAGLSAARRLLQLDASLRVAVLEAGRVAEGAAGRNSGFMIDLPHELTSSDYAGSGDDRALIGLNRQAIAFAREAVQDYDIAPAYFDPAGKINGAASAGAVAHNVSYARHLDSLSEPYEMLDAAQMREVTGSSYYEGGLYTPGTVMLQPAGYVLGLAAGLARQADVYEQSPVTEIRRKGGDWRVATQDGAVTAGRVILANNGHLESFGFAKGRLMHLFLYASMTHDLPKGVIKGQARWGVTPSDPMGTTVRRIGPDQGGDRIVTRTYATLRSGMQASARDLARATALQRQKFDERFPQLAGTKPAYEWAGHLCLSLNSVSVVGALDDGMYSACVQNGLGTARGTLSGIGAAEMALGQHSQITEAFAAEEAPKRLPPQPFRDIGANLVIRIKERGAARE
jgi:glycine/D-amino acid oxidase-like deaminating enzyme